jgi:hypothetical protein
MIPKGSVPLSLEANLVVLISLLEFSDIVTGGRKLEASDFTIILPFGNERTRIDRTMERISRSFPNRPVEFILVSGGDSDGSFEAIADIANKLSNKGPSLKVCKANSYLQSGKWGALIAGMLLSLVDPPGKGSRIVMTDFDLPYGLSGIWDCARSTARVVKGVRKFDFPDLPRDFLLEISSEIEKLQVWPQTDLPAHIVGTVPNGPLWGGWTNDIKRQVRPIVKLVAKTVAEYNIPDLADCFLSQFARHFFPTISLTDTQAGIMALDRDVAERVLPLLMQHRFAGDVEMLHLLGKLGFDVQSKPVQAKYYGQGTISAYWEHKVNTILGDILEVASKKYWYEINLTSLNRLGAEGSSWRDWLSHPRLRYMAQEIGPVTPNQERELGPSHCARPWLRGW